MIVIKITACKLAVKGHAGYAPIGQDIICAGVSTLYGTYRYSTNAKESLDGEWRILEAEPTYRNRAVCDAVRIGCEMLAEQYPKHVKILSAYPAQVEK